MTRRSSTALLRVVKYVASGDVSLTNALAFCAVSFVASGDASLINGLAFCAINFVASGDASP